MKPPAAANRLPRMGSLPRALHSLKALHCLKAPRSLKTETRTARCLKGLAALSCAFLGGCDGRDAAPLLTRLDAPFVVELAHFERDSAIAPLPESVSVDPKRRALGERLFRDARLSFDSKVSCETCHSSAFGGANGQARSSLPNRKPVPINIPSVFNLAFVSSFAWSGKFQDIGQQIDTAMALEVAMNSTWEEALGRVAGDYKEDFLRVYGGDISVEFMRDALSQYCLSLVTPDSKFDLYLRGETKLSAKEQKGYERFREYGCVSCHQGVNVGGNMHQRFGIVYDYFAGRSELSKADMGLFTRTGREEDRHVFRVPSLRNVALTAPYFHDGSVNRLEEAVQVMAHYQLGRELADDEADEIAAFLRTLTGVLKSH